MSESKKEPTSEVEEEILGYLVSITPLLYGGCSSGSASSGRLCPQIGQRPHQQFNRT